jgi:2-polyprenyl-6-methoxyphenol hydroxylase-like FAD-dependent oxidoreductase
VLTFCSTACLKCTDLKFPPYSSEKAGSAHSTASSAEDYGALATLDIVPNEPAEDAAITSRTDAQAPTGARAIHARLVVAADGPGSPTRQAAGLRTVRISYKQRAVVATVTTEPHATAWQRFLPTGPLALLPARHGTQPMHAQHSRTALCSTLRRLHHPNMLHLLLREGLP